MCAHRAVEHEKFTSHKFVLIMERVCPV
jgi:hypothetical protein